jgi:hypothetical protein
MINRMKVNSFSLAISKPCAEDWNAMQTVQGGRYCSSCCKTVVDFSTMSNEGIAEFFRINTGKKVCGNFQETQLRETFTLNYRTPFYFNTRVLSYSLAGILFFADAQVKAQSVIKGAQVIKDNSGKSLAGTSIAGHGKNQLVLKVTDDLGFALQGAVVTVESVKESFVTDSGYLRIHIPTSLQNKKLKVTVTAAGYETVVTVIDLKNSSSVQQITLQAYRRMMKGEVMVIPDKGKNKCGNK